MMYKMYITRWSLLLKSNKRHAGKLILKLKNRINLSGIYIEKEIADIFVD